VRRSPETKSRIGVLLLLAAATRAWAADPSALIRLFPEEADVVVPEARLARLPLPPAVLAACRPDLSDLRLFDPAGQEVPFLVDAGRAAGVVVTAERSAEPRVVDVRRWRETRAQEPPRAREEYRLALPDTPPEGGAWELVVETPRAEFTRRASVSGVADGRPRLLVEDAPLVRVAGAERTRIALPAGTSGEITIVVSGDESEFLEPRFRLESSRTLGPGADLAVVPLAATTTEMHDGVTIIEAGRPPGLVPELLRIESTTPSFDRRVAIWDVRPGRPDVRLGGGRVLRLGTRTTPEQRDVELAPARGQRLRLEIVDGDSPPLADVRLSLLVRRPALLFSMPSAGDRPAGTLRFGGGRAFRPRYDLAALLGDAAPPATGDAAQVAGRLYDPAEVAEARLGPPRPNPAFDAAPALAFAMRRGAAVDVRTYAWRRRLAVPATREGLVRVPLATADAARLRPDLGDLRVVDGESRQWPYLLERDAAEEWLALGTTGPTSRDGRSRWLLVAPEPVLATRLRLDVETMFFHRAFRLLGRDTAGGEVVLAAGELVHDTRRTEPVTVDLLDVRLETIELEITDGDDAPLALRGAEALVTLPALFVAAPAGDYTLLLGDPDARTPQYDVARARDVILAVPAESATPGPAEANPLFSQVARLAGADRPRRWLEQGVVWAVLLAAVVVLGLLTMRAARKSG
jgi:hypothetical protein